MPPGSEALLAEEKQAEKARFEKEGEDPFAAEETIQTIFGDFIPKANRLLSLAAVLHRASL
jgi:predicted phage gp36 major capsid-like protein